MHPKQLSPKELAAAIGVSESSIKRWVDAGLMAVNRTAGGHRRIALSEAVRFVRDQGMDILRPDLLGLPDLKGVPVEAREGGLSGEALYQVLHRGEATKARGMIAAAYLSGMPLESLFDGPVVEALGRLGEMWRESSRGIYIEHRATTICIEAVSQVRSLVPPPGPGAPVAVGGGAPDDIYILPSLMAATLLQDLGYDAVNLGPQVPGEALLHAVEATPPRFVWIALTSDLDDRRRAQIRGVLAALRDAGIPAVLGGRAALAHRSAWREDVPVLASMAELKAYAEALVDASPVR